MTESTALSFSIDWRAPVSTDERIVGGIAVPWGETSRLTPDPAGERRAYEQAQLHGRLVTPEEVADAIAYLLSPTAGSTMGAALVVDGGYIIR